MDDQYSVLFHYYSLGDVTAMPRELHVRLCHAFLVFDIFDTYILNVGLYGTPILIAHRAVAEISFKGHLMSLAMSPSNAEGYTS